MAAAWKDEKLPLPLLGALIELYSVIRKWIQRQRAHLIPNHAEATVSREFAEEVNGYRLKLLTSTGATQGH